VSALERRPRGAIPPHVMNSPLRDLATTLLLALGATACVSRPLDRPVSPDVRLESALSNRDDVEPAVLARTLRGLSLESSRHVPTLVADAAVSLSEGRNARALALVEAALRLDPAHVDAVLIRIRLAALDGDIARAEQRIDAALRMKPDEAALHEGRASLHFIEGEYAEALDALDRADRLDDGSSPRRRFDRGLVEEHMGDDEAAMASYRSCLDLDAGFEPAARRLRALETRPEARRP